MVRLAVDCMRNLETGIMELVNSCWINHAFMPPLVSSSRNKTKGAFPAVPVKPESVATVRDEGIMSRIVQRDANLIVYEDLSNIRQTNGLGRR